VALVLAMLRNCTEAAYQVNKSRMVRVAEYSRDCLKQLRAETGIAYDERTQGTLQLFRTQKQLDGIGKDVDILRESGVPFQVLDRTATWPTSRPWPWSSTSSSAPCACRATRPATATSSPASWPPWPKRWGGFRFGTTITASSRTGGASPASAPTPVC
jgi:hypothetical protein